jgi:hypothetical protein
MVARKSGPTLNGPPTNVALFHTYQLHIRVTHSLRLAIGRLGRVRFPAGPLRLHRLGPTQLRGPHRPPPAAGENPALAHRLSAHPPGVTVTEIIRSQAGECDLNQATPGAIPVPGFGASDCGHGCGSHLKYLGW